MEEVKKAVQAAVKELFNVDMEPELTRPDEQFGDYATNVALQLAGKLNRNPKEIANQLAEHVKGSTFHIKDVKVEGSGFLNIVLTDEFLARQAFGQKIAQPFKDQEILVEFGDPNPFKEMHIGHLYSYIVGDSISRLLEASGATVRRLSYHGDVGLHVAKAIWGMQQAAKLNGDHDIGDYYQAGAKAYDEDEEAKQLINEINEHVYKKDNEEVNKYYELGKKQSFASFDEVLKKLDIATDRRYLESESMPVGINFVKQNTGKVFEESDGAIVYKGEKQGLHTRVFITSKGLPTYETKDLGLAELKKVKYPNLAKSIIITAHEQSEYFKVMLAALAEIDKELADKTTHLSHGFISLSTGKMSSRTGKIFRAMDLMDDVTRKLKEQYPDSPEGTDLAGIKYGFLKHRLGSDIIYDVDESISIQGNSGPYLQYAHARARSILQKSPVHSPQSLAKDQPPTAMNILEGGERSLVRKLGEYPEVVAKAVLELMPHHICTYLYELAQTFNRFYESNRVIDDPRQAERLKIVSLYADVLKNGLSLLNIHAPEKM